MVPPALEFKLLEVAAALRGERQGECLWWGRSLDNIQPDQNDILVILQQAKFGIYTKCKLRYVKIKLHI